MNPATTVPVDGTDPLVVLLAWIITLGINRWCKKNQHAKLRHLAPGFAILAAIGLRSAIEASQGHPLTLETMLRAVAAGGVAVVSHSQIREVQKAIAREPLEKGKRGAPEGAPKGAPEVDPLLAGADTVPTVKPRNTLPPPQD